MNAEHVAAVSVTCVLGTQLAKFVGVPDRYGPLVVLVIAAVGVALFRFSLGTPLAPADAWALPVAWLTVTAASAGVYGFSRAAQPAAVTRAQSPPAGAFQEPHSTAPVRER